MSNGRNKFKEDVFCRFSLTKHWLSDKIEIKRIYACGDFPHDKETILNYCGSGKMI